MNSESREVLFEPEQASERVVFRNLCHFSIIKKIGVTHDSIFRFQQSIS